MTENDIQYSLFNLEEEFDAKTDEAIHTKVENLKSLKIESFENELMNSGTPKASKESVSELVEEVFPFDIGDRVKIILPEDNNADVETYFYLKDFSGQRGEVLKVIEKPCLQYEVSFKNNVAIVYHRELVSG